MTGPPWPTPAECYLAALASVTSTSIGADGGTVRAGLAVRLPLRQATAVIESITADEDLVSVQLYGHPWVIGEYWP